MLQVCTSDLTAPAAALLAWLRCRWRIENVFKYLTAHHGMDWLCHYEADTAPDTTPIDNPARKQARDAVKRAQTTLADAQRALTRLLRSDATVAEINAAIPAAQTAIDTAEAALTNAKSQLKTIPAKIPANQHNPQAQRPILRTQRRSLQMVLRLLAFDAEQWLADRLNTYLADNDEYRTTLRHLLHLGGHITYTPKSITVVLDPPPTPKITTSAPAAARRTQRHATAHTRRQPPHHLQDQNSLSARADLNRDLHPSSGGLGTRLACTGGYAKAAQPGGRIPGRARAGTQLGGSRKSV